MSGVWTIFRRDLSRMIHSNVMGMLIVLFLVMMGALFFVDYFKDVRVLNLRPFFSQAPLLLSIFCPALTMGTIAGERRAQTLQWLETTPVGSFEIVAGKFLSCLALLSVVLCFTLSYPLTLSCLGLGAGCGGVSCAGDAWRYVYFAGDFGLFSVTGSNFVASFGVFYVFCADVSSSDSAGFDGVVGGGFGDAFGGRPFFEYCARGGGYPRHSLCGDDSVFCAFGGGVAAGVREISGD